ncbi:uncharacterized protein V1516DRAFT_663191 [Lipomyces oligophaga]|uniref:uncharacterized protein n=1 Tax=Lipomyces oligophaga TaxID=45792 RepID=UPI0034CFA649
MASRRKPTVKARAKKSRLGSSGSQKRTKIAKSSTPIEEATSQSLSTTPSRSPFSLPSFSLVTRFFGRGEQKSEDKNETRSPSSGTLESDSAVLAEALRSSSPVSRDESSPQYFLAEEIIKPVPPLRQVIDNDISDPGDKDLSLATPYLLRKRKSDRIKDLETRKYGLAAMIPENEPRSTLALRSSVASRGKRGRPRKKSIESDKVLNQVMHLTSPKSALKTPYALRNQVESIKKQKTVLEAEPNLLLEEILTGDNQKSNDKSLKDISKNSPAQKLKPSNRKRKAPHGTRTKARTISKVDSNRSFVKAGTSNSSKAKSEISLAASDQRENNRRKKSGLFDEDATIINETKSESSLTKESIEAVEESINVFLEDKPDDSPTPRAKTSSKIQKKLNRTRKRSNAVSKLYAKSEPDASILFSALSTQDTSPPDFTYKQDSDSEEFSRDVTTAEVAFNSIFGKLKSPSVEDSDEDQESNFSAFFPGTKFPSSELNPLGLGRKQIEPKDNVVTLQASDTPTQHSLYGLPEKLKILRQMTDKAKATVEALQTAEMMSKGMYNLSQEAAKASSEASGADNFLHSKAGGMPEDFLSNHNEVNNSHFLFFNQPKFEVQSFPRDLNFSGPLSLLEIEEDREMLFLTGFIDNLVKSGHQLPDGLVCWLLKQVAIEQDQCLVLSYKNVLKRCKCNFLKLLDESGLDEIYTLLGSPSFLLSNGSSTTFRAVASATRSVGRRYSFSNLIGILEVLYDNIIRQSASDPFSNLHHRCFIFALSALIDADAGTSRIAVYASKLLTLILDLQTEESWPRARLLLLHSIFDLTKCSSSSPPYMRTLVLKQFPIEARQRAMSLRTHLALAFFLDDVNRVVHEPEGRLPIGKWILPELQSNPIYRLEEPAVQNPFDEEPTHSLIHEFAIQSSEPGEDEDNLDTKVVSDSSNSPHSYLGSPYFSGVRSKQISSTSPPLYPTLTQKITFLDYALMTDFRYEKDNQKYGAVISILKRIYKLIRDPILLTSEERSTAKAAILRCESRLSFVLDLLAPKFEIPLPHSPNRLMERLPSTPPRLSAPSPAKVNVHALGRTSPLRNQTFNDHLPSSPSAL